MPRKTSINTIPAGKGYVRIDALVPGAIGYDIINLALASGQVKDFWMSQLEVGGNMLLDATVSAPLATLMLAKAKQCSRAA
jgi:hypothetical protein